MARKVRRGKLSLTSSFVMIDKRVFKGILKAPLDRSGDKLWICYTVRGLKCSF